MLRFNRTLTLAFIFMFILTSNIPISNADTSVSVNISSSGTNKTNNLQLGVMLDHYNWQYFCNDQYYRDILQNMNCKIVRIFLFRMTVLKVCSSWDSKTHTGVFDFTKFDDLIKKIYGIGAVPIVCIMNGYNNVNSLYLPTGMITDPKTNLPYPEDFAEYCRILADYYKPESTNYPINRWEVMNEPYSYWSWTEDITKVGYMMDVYQHSYVEIHKANPSAKVSFDASVFKDIANYMLAHGMTVDFVDSHTYGTGAYGTETSLVYNAARLIVDESTSYYSSTQAKAVYGVTESLNGESNFNSAWRNGTDARNNLIEGAVYDALTIYYASNAGMDYKIHYNFVNGGTVSPAGGIGFGIVNPNKEKTLPYYLYEMVGKNLFRGDVLTTVTSSDTNMKVLSWIGSDNNNRALLINRGTSNMNININISGTLQLLTSDGVNNVDVTNNTPFSMPMNSVGLLIEDQTIIVNKTIYITSDFNGGGKTYIHGSGLGDYPLFRLTGSGVTLSNLIVDDNHFLGVWSAVDIGGTDNTVEYVTLKNSSRYGLTFGGALRGTYRHITIEECQHGISGSSGQLSDWNPSVDCLIEDCYIQGMSVCGIKLKNFLRLTIRNNQIDINSEPNSNKSGIYFAGSDTASKFCLVENNNVFSSTPYRGYGINIHQDTDPNIVFSEGNVVRNNKITGTNIGIRLTGSHFNIYNNKMINVKTEYEVKTLVYGSPTFQPPSDNIVIEYNNSIDTTKLDPENWFGFTYPSQLSYDADIWHTAIHKGEQWDFTVYRVPFLFSNYSIEKLDAIVNLIGSHGGKVILDFHCLNQYTTTPDLIGSPIWVSNWLFLAEYYKSSDIVIGFELANEPFTLSRYTGYIDDVSLCNLLYSTAVSIHNINPNKYIVFPPINFLKNSPYPHTLIGLNSVLTIHPYDYGSKSTWSELKAIADYRFGAQISGWDSTFDFVWMGEIEGHDVGSGGATTFALEEQYLTYCIDLALENKFGFCLWKYNYAHDDGELNQDTVLEKSKYMDSPTVPVITVPFPPQQIALYSAPSNSDILRYTYAIVSYTPTPSEISAWKIINPNFRAYRYRNFEQIYISSSDYTYFRDNDMLLKDINGNYIFNKDYPTTDICVDIGSPLYIEFMKKWVQNNVLDYGYDGIFMDNFVRPTYPPSWTQERGVNPRTDKLYTDEEWFNDSMVLLREVKTTGVKAVGNGIPQADGVYGYWANEDRCNMIVEDQDGVLIEGPVAWSLQDFNSRNSGEWKQNVDMLDVLIDSDMLVWFSNSGSIDLETEDISRFVYYTYLMVGESSNYSIKFRGSTFMSGNYWSSLVSQDLGLPLTDMAQEGDEYTRSFVEGTIRINPTTKTSSFTNLEVDPPVVVIDGSTKPNTGGLDTKLDLKDTKIDGTPEMKSSILSTPAVSSGLSETANVMVQIIPIFGIVMAVGATTGKVNIKVLLGFLVAIVFVVLFSNIMI